MVAKFDLTLMLREIDEGIAGGIEYTTALFERSTIERYLGIGARCLKRWWVMRLRRSTGYLYLQRRSVIKCWRNGMTLKRSIQGMYPRVV